MNLLNTIALPNQHVAHGQDYIAVYADGVVSTYRKNRIDNTVDLQPVTYSVDGVLSLRMSQNGQIIAVQTATQTIRLQNGTQTPFNNIGRFDIANTGHLIIVDAVNGAVQVITNSTTNLAIAVTDDDRVVCGRQGYMVYNTARTLLGVKFADVTFTNTPAAKEIVHCLHIKDDKYAIFYKDGTATYDGITRAVAGPNAGFREAGSHLLSTDYKQDFYTSRFNPLSDAKSLRTFKWLFPPLASAAQWAALKLMATGNAINTGFDSKNALAVVNSGGMTVVPDAPFGVNGNSLNFDGSTSLLQTADSANIQLANADFTIEFFIKVASGATGIITVLNKGGGLNISWSSFLLQAIVDTKSFCFAASFTNTKLDVGTSDGVGSWGSFEFDEWTHIAITRKVNVWRCFSNGKLGAKYNVAGSVFANSGRGLSIGHSRQNDFNSGTVYGRLKGRLHALAIHNYAKYTSNFVVDTIPLALDTRVPPATLSALTWMQMSFAGGTALEEVSGTVMPLAATASITNNKLVNTDATVTVMDKLTPVYFNAVEDFSIEGWFNFSSVDPAFAATILCVDASNGDADRSFNLNVYPTGNTAGFILSANGTTGGYSLNGTYAFQANTDHHLAACRVGGVLTIYLDGVSIYSGANNTASFKSTQFLNVRRGAIGKRWGLRVVRGASAYSAAFTPPVSLPPLLANNYAPAVQSDVVFQTCFRGNSLNDEVTSSPLTLSGAGITAAEGRLKISQTGSTSRFEKFIPYFGAGDYTIEVLLRVVSTAANENCIMGQYVNPGQNNSWLMWYSAGMGFIFYSNSTAGGLVGLTATKTLPVNTDVHLVIEKYNNVLTIYMDGVACGTVANTQPLSDNSATIPVRNWWGDNSMSNNMLIKYIRIAKRAMYQGAVTTKAVLPRIV